MKIPTIALLAMVSAPFAHAQFGSGIVFDPTQSAHAIEQISKASQSSQTLKLADNAIDTYNLAHQMAWPRLSLSAVSCRLDVLDGSESSREYLRKPSAMDGRVPSILELARARTASLERVAPDQWLWIFEF